MEKKSNLGLEIIYWGLLLMTLNIFAGVYHWPLGIFTVILMFLGIALGIWQIFREKKSGEKMAVVMLNFFTKFFLIIGLVFQANHWPGSILMLWLSFLLYFISVAVSSCIAVYKERNERLYILLLIAILSCSLIQLISQVQHSLQGLQ